MLIRSQDGMSMSNIGNSLGIQATEFCVSGTEIWARPQSGGTPGIRLGVYTSTGRCKEIITDICEQYQRFLNFPGAEGNAVFQMPEE